MANWRNLCKAALLADGQIDEREVNLIRKEFFADGRIDRTELEFLLEVRREAKAVVPSFQKLLFEAIRNVILRDGSTRPPPNDAPLPQQPHPPQTT